MITQDITHLQLTALPYVEKYMIKIQAERYKVDNQVLSYPFAKR